MCFKAWTNITSDKWVLDIVRNGYTIEFLSQPPITCRKKQIQFNAHESCIINNEIDKLLHKGVIRQIPVSEVKFVSSIFVRPKRDGSHRLILNLRDLNHYVVFFLFLSLYTARPSFEYYRQVYFVHSGLQDESLQVTISKLP